MQFVTYAIEFLFLNERVLIVYNIESSMMYQNVCSEYITLLNSDLVSARHEIIEKGLATPIKGANKGK